MSIWLGMVLSKNSSNEVLNEIKNKYDLELEIKNHSNELLKPDESFYVVSGSMAGSGVSSYKSYTSYYEDMEELIEAWGFDMYYQIITEINERHLLGAHKWMEIIRDLKSNYKISKVGLLNFAVNGMVEDLKFDKKPRIDIDIFTMNAVTLMKLECEKIYMFV